MNIKENNEMVRATGGLLCYLSELNKSDSQKDLFKSIKVVSHLTL
jgi:hypothetical protein